MDWSRSGRRLCAAVVISVVGAACGADASGENADGASLYVSNCASCHGTQLEGNAAGPPLRSVIYGADEYGDDELAAAITDGVGDPRWGIGVMPSFGNLSDAQIERIVAHVRAEQDRLGLLDVTP